MKSITLITTVAVSGFAALVANATPAKAPAEQEKQCCTQASDKPCDDQCWLDIETITIEAANGDPIAQYAIAWITDTGMNNTPKDPEKANEMYTKALPGLEKAAKEGNVTACHALANMYANGKGVEKNPDKAKEIMAWCKKCCEKKAKDKAAEAQQQPAADM